MECLPRIHPAYTKIKNRIAMKTWKVTLVVVTVGAMLSMAFTLRRLEEPKRKYAPFVPPKGCVYRTVMGEESSDSGFVYKTPEKVLLSVNRGMGWIAKAQSQNGGWGAGSHSRQDITDPHA